MSKEHPTHTIHLRESKAAPETVTAEQLAQVEKTIPNFKSRYEVAPIEVVEKPAPLAKAVDTGLGKLRIKDDEPKKAE